MEEWVGESERQGNNFGLVIPKWFRKSCMSWGSCSLIASNIWHWNFQEERSGVRTRTGQQPPRRTRQERSLNHANSFIAFAGYSFVYSYQMDLGTHSRPKNAMHIVSAPRVVADAFALSDASSEAQGRL